MIRLIGTIFVAFVAAFMLSKAIGKTQKKKTTELPEPNDKDYLAGVKEVESFLKNDKFKELE